MRLSWNESCRPRWTGHDQQIPISNTVRQRRIGPGGEILNDTKFQIRMFQSKTIRFEFLTSGIRVTEHPAICGRIPIVNAQVPMSAGLWCRGSPALLVPGKAEGSLPKRPRLFVIPHSQFEFLVNRPLQFARDQFTLPCILSLFYYKSNRYSVASAPGIVLLKAIGRAFARTRQRTYCWARFLLYTPLVTQIRQFERRRPSRRNQCT